MDAYIDIEKELIPYRFDVSLAGVLFTFEINYNAEDDYFTVDLERDQGVLVTGEKIVYGLPLFVDVADSRFPAISITPLDSSRATDTVSMATLSGTVFLYIGAEEDA
ncbi:hypothetical protein SAMN02799624_04544 [Paenibacillus sp. UNC496MF]|uniref:phage baseplate plug family protein n=1 Tax=Paenibacillus sp. UNC496MF TaxID=1502753 RepID=UPI0008EA210E|nr:hypothetical protein [Paenibacillus sp. UNC496MF]SFJ44416.1 hypothetical protein SAMN02799624_04544 [Paenibacillus sp. UNC496MF]